MKVELCSDTGRKKLVETDFESWIELGGKGAYTTVRLDRNSKVLLFSRHIQRLIATLKPISLCSPDTRTTEEYLRTHLSEVIRSLAQSFELGTPLRVYIHLPATPAIIRALAEPIPPIEELCAVLVESSRETPTLKSTAWIQKRRRLRSFDRCAEGLLFGPEGISEGFSSNFFAIERRSPPRLVTAGEGVLHGTAREIVLKTAAEMGWEVELRAPRVEEAPQWDSAAVSSTSRGLMPLKSIALPAGRTLEFQNGLAAELRRRVDTNMQEFFEELAPEHH
eukprot:gnl/Chilomastix_cuspidata/1376.p1 GENE.gnl/Chilomastix_cuspidata/1376~~gnl/Chilomastix_cuspidata/1376.p1  ORF type:complete len:312 (-),score=129.83 gnl/Chilomastix_cuspidata/1376:1093-1929(-)